MNLIKEHLILVTNSQFPQEKLDNYHNNHNHSHNHELKKVFMTLKVIMEMMFPYILYSLYKTQLIQLTPEEPQSEDNNLCKMSEDNQLLDKVKECKCHVTSQFTELQLVIIQTP
jgi:hypothetical protein